MKFRILFILLVLSPFLIVAQKGVYIGFSGDVGASFILNQNTYGVKWNFPNNRNFELAYDGTLSYSGKLNVGYNFKQQFGIEWQMGYQSAGMKYEDTDRNGVIHRRDVDLNYVTIVAALRYSSIFKKNRYKQAQKVRLAIVAGPQIGILTNANLQYDLDFPNVISVDDASLNYPFEFTDYNDSDVYTGPVESDKDFFSKVDIGLLVKVGVDIYPTEKFYVAPALTGYIGLTDMNNSDYRKHDGYGAGHNASIGFSLTMGFYLSRSY